MHQNRVAEEVKHQPAAVRRPAQREERLRVFSDKPPALVLGWDAVSGLVSEISAAVLADGPPDTVVGILRGGMIPAVQLAHLMGIRSVRAVEVTATLSDAIGSPKSSRPVIVNHASLGDIAGRDVLIIDDVAGSGRTIAACRDLARQAGPARIRTAALTVNTVSWYQGQHRPPHDAIEYVGRLCFGWVVFPWERA
jgi:hypothetical protein